jgi:hypothetical protein
MANASIVTTDCLCQQRVSDCSIEVNCLMHCIRHTVATAVMSALCKLLSAAAQQLFSREQEKAHKLTSHLSLPRHCATSLYRKLTRVCRYKLEAIEATYLCCAGAPNREEDGGVHADRCVEMALTMMAIADHAV